MGVNTDSMELLELDDHQFHRDAARRARATLVRLCGAAGSVAALIVVLVGLPKLGIGYPHSRAIVPGLTAPSETLLRLFGITPVLVAVAALTIVSVVRKLPYGIGAVIGLTVGASLTTAAVRAWAYGLVPASALPNGSVTACAALICGAALVAAPRFVPAVTGLGAVVALTVAGAAVVGGSATVVGIVTTFLIVALWWALASTVMVFSPVAAEREAANPLDTAAMALRRR
ncbi:MAG: hypothetical protein WBQ44_14205 [Rhodococcus sp. (in: high G+C Gram-positive bacteria)]